MTEDAAGIRTDAVDRVIAEWQRERPELDLDALGVFSRLWQAAHLLAPAVEQVFTQHGLRRGEFDVLATLRRSGSPFTLTPSTLAESAMMSRAGMTNRLDRLEAAGLVERGLDPDDRRSFLITLTDNGREVIDATISEHADNLQRLISGLPAGQVEALDNSLRLLIDGLSR